MYQTTDFTKGLKVEFKDEVWTIVEFQHINPGKGSAFVKTKLKNLQTKKVLELNFKAGVDKLKIPDVEFHSMQYLYCDGTNYHFMNEKTYDQISLTEEEISDAKPFLLENCSVKTTFYKKKPINVEVENFVEMKVIETPPNFKGDTTSSGGKPATMETGLKITVPFHILEGDLIKIDTRNKKYIEKVK